MVNGSIRRVVAAAGAALVIAAVTATAATGAVAAAEDELPSSMHGAVETQAVTAGLGALALLVDPGTAYAYSTLDRDDYGGGSVSYTMTARGANLNLGTIALAVLWAAPDCTEGKENSSCVLSGGTGGPNTGLHEAGGFPAYAEALYPPPPEGSGVSRERVYKCVVNKDAPGAAPTNGSADSVCRSSDAVPMSAWAEAVGDDHRAKGFSRAAGFDAGVLKVGGSESRSDVRHAGKGSVVSEGMSAATDISILGGQVALRSAKATGRVVGAADGSGSESVACSFSGLTIAGAAVGIDDLGPDGGAGALLDQVEAATGFRVEIIPPSAPVAARRGGKQVAECTGIRVFVTDVRAGSPVPVCTPVVSPDVPQCVPGLGNRFEFTFGKISVQQSVQDFDVGAFLGGAGGLADALTVTPSDLGPTSAFTPTAAGPPSAPPTAAIAAPPASATGAVQYSGGSGTGRGTASATSSHGAFTPATAGPPPARPNLALIGALTAGSSIGLIGGVFLLIYVVNSLAAGRR